MVHLEGIVHSPEQVQTAHDLGLDFVKQGGLNDHLAGAKQRVAMWCLRLTYSIEHFGKDNALRFADEVFPAFLGAGWFVHSLPNGEGFLSGCIAHGDFTNELHLDQAEPQTTSSVVLVSPMSVPVRGYSRLRYIFKCCPNTNCRNSSSIHTRASCGKYFSNRMK